MFRILTILLLLSTVNCQLSTVHAQRLSENPTKPGWKFQGMSGKNWIQVGVYTDSAALAAAAIPRAWVGTTGADSTQGLLAYTKTDSTFWGFSGTRWHRMGQVGKPGISSISYRPGNVVDTLYYTSPNGDVNFYFNVVRDGLLAGGSVTYAGSARTYFVTAAVFRKNGLFYYTPDTTITIPALASPDSSRTDVFVLNTSSQATTITGVESANPLTPQIDPDSQVFLTTVTLRPANQSAGVDTVIIYDQNTEWTGSATGMTANFNNTSPTWRGSKSVDVGAVNNGDRLEFVNASLLNRNSYAGISMFLRLKGIVPNNNNLNVSFWNGTTQVSNMLNLPLNKSNTSSWQGVSLSFSSFTWTNDLFDRVRIQFAGSGAGTSGYYLDFVYLQNGISTPPPATNFLQDVRRTGDLLEKQLNGTWTTWANISDKLNRADSAAGGYYPYSTNPKGYLQAADIAGKLNTSDTASMLNAYLRKADTSLMLNPYMRTAWFNGYFDARFATKTSDNLTEGSTNLYYTAARAALKLNISDTATMMRNAVRSVYRKAGSDSVFAVSGAGTVFAFRDSIGGGSMVYPGAGIAVSTGSAWGTSITDNSANWNTAFSWGNHASAGYVPQTRTITINGTSYDLSANRSWTVSGSGVPIDSVAVRRIPQGTFTHYVGFNSGPGSTGTSGGNVTTDNVLAGPNFVIGKDAGKSLRTSGRFDGNNIFLGNESGEFVTNASFLVGIGFRTLGGAYTSLADTLWTATSGGADIAIGYEALARYKGNNGTQTSNIAIGSGAMDSYTGCSGCTNSQVAIGTNALGALTTGLQNTAVGYGALSSVTVNSGNTAVGGNSLVQATGQYNTALGFQALYGIVAQSNNVGIGYNTGVSATGGLNTWVGASSGSSGAGNYNVGLGASASTGTSGSYNNIIGYSISPLSNTASEQLTIGSNNIRWVVSDLSGSHRRWTINGTTSNITANTTSVTLDVTGTLGGVRFPLLTQAQRNALTATNGLMIYCTDCLDSGGVNAGVLQVYQASTATWKNAF